MISSADKAWIAAIGAGVVAFFSQSLHCQLPTSTGQWATVIVAFLTTGGATYFMPNKKAS